MKRLIMIYFKRSQNNRYFKKTFLAILVCVPSILGLPFDVTGTPLAISTFDTNDEGWSVTGDVHGFQWQSGIGNPPGSVLGIDDVLGDTWGFLAPSKFLGNQGAAYGNTLSYDIKITASETSPWLSPDISLTGGGLTINLYEQSPVVNVWTSYEVLLTELAGWKKSDDTIPTAAEMEQVLGNLTRLYIRAEYKSGADQANLDNVVLTPQPATMCLFGLGALSLLRRKNSKKTQMA
jgi:hypothetical protein